MAVKNKKKWKSRLITALLSNLFLVGTIFVFAPLEVYVGNFLNFHFGFGITCQIMILAALAVLCAVTLIEMLLPRKAALMLNALTVGVGICCYVQMMFLNGKMVKLTGADMITTRAERIANLGIWAAIILAIGAGAALLLHKKKSKILHSGLRSVSLMLTVMQTAGLLSVALTTDMSSAGGYMLAGDGRFEVAPKNNTLVFILDSAENSIFDSMLEQFPDVHDAFSGFTYYSNATSMHSRTYPSLMYMLTGKVCHYDQPAEEYMRKAVEEGAMLKGLKEAGVDNRVFMWGVEKFTKAAKPFVSNLVITGFNSLESVSVPHLLEGMLNISLYKAMPYRIKYALEYSMERINQRVIRHDHEPYQYYDYEYYQDLKSSELTVNEEYAGAFRFYHLHGSHHDMYWDENMVRIDVLTKEQPLRGSLKIIEEYMRKLDEKGLLDETTIIVTADHGQFDKINSVDIKNNRKIPPNPMLLVKYADSDMSKPLEISQAPVSHAEMIATVMEGCGLNDGTYGQTFREIPEHEKREREYYYTLVRSGKEESLIQFLIDGDANSFENWEFSGNQWDIQYSVY